MMTLGEALERVISDGIEAARADYSRPGDELRRDGAVLGFEECRGKTPSELKRLLEIAEERANQAFRHEADDYWFWRCRAAEVGWVVNVVSCLMHEHGLAPVGIMTARGMLKAAEIVGVRGEA